MVFAYLSGRKEDGSDDAGRAPMAVRTGNLPMTLTCSFGASHSPYSSLTFGYGQFHCHQSGFIVTLPAGISADSDTVGWNESSRKDGFDPILCILARHPSSEVGGRQKLLC